MGKCVVILSCLFQSFLLVANALAYVPSAELIGSPALLVNYSKWNHSQQEYSIAGTEKFAFKQLVEILYDFDIERPWGDRYYPELNQRIKNFQGFLCDQGRSPLSICKFDPHAKRAANVAALKGVVVSPLFLKFLEQRWLVAVEVPSFKNVQRSFNLILSTERTKEEIIGAKGSKKYYWKFDQSIPISDIDTYRLGFEAIEFAGHFSLVSDGVEVNDWLLRNRAMNFAQDWKKEKDRDTDLQNSGAPQNLSKIFDAKAILYLRSFEPLVFEQKYQDLFKSLLPASPAAVRFIKERANGKYPEEVYQHIAYEMCLDLLKIQSAYFLVETQKPNPRSVRKISLQSILALLENTKYPLFLRSELYNRSQPLISYAHVIDQMIKPELAMAFALEELKAAAGFEEYANETNWEKFASLFEVPDLWDQTYLENEAPKVISMLKNAKGEPCAYADLSPDSKREVLRAYLYSNKGKVNLIALARLYAVLMVDLSPDLTRLLLDSIHRIRLN